MTNRGMMKWQAFNAVSPGGQMVNNVLKEKNKFTMPELSEEQISNFEKLIVESYTNQENLLLLFFRNGSVFKKNVIVNNINSITSKISFTDGTSLFFKQIINIKKI